MPDMAQKISTTGASAKPQLLLQRSGRVPLLLLACLLLLSGSVLIGKTAAPAELRSGVDVREGPGSFYPMVVRLRQHAPLTVTGQTEGWTEISSGDFAGWIPSLALKGGDTGEAEPAGRFESLRDRFDQAFEDEPGDCEPYVSEAQVVAAVKGFIENNIAAAGSDLNDLSHFFDYRYDPPAYMTFRDSRISSKNWRQVRGTHRLDDIPSPPAPQPELDMLGWAAGNRIAQIGVYDDPQLRTYLNHVAMLVTESSHRPDIHVTVILLDTDDITGYAVPGGLVFVSVGAVRLMRTEAEFAAFIGHEIAHLVFRHGETELEKRGTRIRADHATRRMDRLIEEAGMADERYRDVTAELQEAADKLFEYLIADRLHAYEAEADRYGMVYASRAGYRADALYNVIERISLFHREPESERKSAWYGDTLHNRLDAIRAELERKPMRQGTPYAREWENQTRHLRHL